jgi:hypothetical protein
VIFENEAPEDLTKYVAGKFPYGTLRSFVEVFIPREAELTGVLVDGVPNKYRPYVEEDVRSIAVFVKIRRLSQRSITIEYELPEAPRYSYVLRPQPLARDARVELYLRVPDGWSATEPLEGDGRYTYSGTLEGPIEIEAGPDLRRGLPALWNRLIGAL